MKFPKLKYFNLSSLTLGAVSVNSLVHANMFYRFFSAIKNTISHSSLQDNFNGPVGLLTACGIGIMRTIRAAYETDLDSIAVDVVAKTLIVAGWRKGCNSISSDDQIVAETNEIPKEMTVYNCSTLHSMKLGKIVYLGQFLVRIWPFEKTVWLPGGGVTMCPYMNYLRVSGKCNDDENFHSRLDDLSIRITPTLWFCLLLFFFLHPTRLRQALFFQILPALVLDQAMKFNGKKPM